MTDQYITRFRAGTAEQRRVAIMKLGKGGDSRAINVLQQIARSEPDPALQKLAAQAIQHLQKATEPAASASLPAVSNPSAMNVAARMPAIDPDVIDAEVIDEHKASAFSAAMPDAVAEPPKRKIVTDQQRNLAKSKLDQVITHQMADEYPQALVRLAEAAALDPDILNTTIGNNLAQTLTDLPRDQAIAEVLARSQVLDVKKPRRAAPVRVESDGSDLLVDVLIELALFAIILLINASLSSLSSLINLSSQQRIPLALTAGVVFSGALGLFLVQFVGNLISTVVIYNVGRWLGGVGGLLRFIRYTVRANLLTYGLLTISSVLSVIPAYQFYQAHPSTPYLSTSPIASLGLFGTAIAYFCSPFLITFAIARAHKFGYFKGCASIFLGSILIILIFVVLAVIAGVAIASLFKR